MTAVKLIYAKKAFTITIHCINHFTIGKMCHYFSCLNIYRINCVNRTYTRTSNKKNAYQGMRSIFRRKNQNVKPHST